MATAYGLEIPDDGGDEDTWGLLLVALWTASYAAFQARTEDADWADYVLSRPKLKDYSETSVSKGSVTGAVTIDVSAGNHQTMTLTGNVTLTISNPPPASTAGFLFLYITQDATGGRTVTFPASFVNEAGTNFTISGTTASKMTEVRAYTLNNGTTWRTVQGSTWA